MNKRFLLLIILGTGLFLTAHAQLSTKQKVTIVDSVVSKLNSYYVFPETAKLIESSLRKQLAKKLYDTVTNEAVFADLLTNDLRQVSNDKHLFVSYSANVLPVEDNNPSEMPQAQKAQYAKWLLAENYGINKLDVLPGNIGYIDFKWFCGPEYGGDTYAAMMNYVAHTDALIIDLRSSNGAMSLQAIPFICSYFFEESTHLCDFYWREKNETVQTWTQTVVPGKKYLNKPIYILTSGKTFSGAEEFAYDLKNLKRATLVGETTGGGANGGGTVRVSDHFEVFIPSGRAISPVTKTNWEGTGVAPDTVAKSNRALHQARMIALQQIIKTTTDGMQKMQLAAMLQNLKSNPPAFKTIDFSLAGFETAKEVYVAGNFNSWSSKSDRLQRKGSAWVAAVEAEPGEIVYKFIVDGRWILDPNNKATKSDGSNTNSLRKVE